MRTLLVNGKISTGSTPSEVQALAIEDGKVVQIGTTDQVRAQAGPGATEIDLGGRRVIPGLNDSHLHVIRAGLYYHLELRWDGVPRLGSALEQLKQQVA